MYFLDLVASREGNWLAKDRDERLYTIIRDYYTHTTGSV